MIATMTELPTEVRLAKQLTAALDTPTFLIDADANLVYYNQAAGILLGLPWQDTWPTLTPAVWGPRWAPTTIEDAPIVLEQLPIMVALEKRRPVHRWLCIVGLDGVRRRIEVTAFPLTGKRGEVLGAVSLFWQPDQT
jgi:PAS domain-containing protein